MGTKHTPGPWKVVNATRLYDDTVKIEGDGRAVAYVPADDTAEIEDGAIAEVLSPEAKADARLIAAAPELLQALEGLWDIIRTSDGAANLAGRLNTGVVHDMVNKALAKARGEV